MIYLDEQTRLISSLFAAALAGGAAEAWPVFLRDLMELTKADGAAISIDRGYGHEVWRAGGGGAPDAEQLSLMRNDRVYDQDHIPRGASAPWLRVMKSGLAGGASAALQISRSRHNRDFRSVDGQLLAMLAPFLSQAAGAWADLRRERMMTALQQRFASYLGLSWLTVERSGVITAISDEARKAGARLGMRLAERRGFELAEPDAARNFRAALAACFAGERAAPVLLSGHPEIELILQREMLAGEIIVTGFLREAPMAGSLPPAKVAAHFGLTPSEARLAALLCDGVKLREAAARLGWTEESARSCSKQIYARMGVSGQGALIRRAHVSGIWLAAGPALDQQGEGAISA